MARFTSEAYDISLFQEAGPRLESLPQEEPRRGEGSPREKVVELPRRKEGRRAKPRRHPVRRGLAALAFCVMFGAVTLVVYNQVQLTELTEQINTATQQLQEAESLEIQLNMEASRQMDGSQVEEYAAQELGMRKVASGQVTYVSVAQADKGAVVREAGSPSFLDKLWATVLSWFD